MKAYIYIMTNSERSTYFAGACSDLEKLLKFYADMPTISTSENKILKMVYCERFGEYQHAIDRFQEITNMNREQKEAVIEDVNPTYADLIPNYNFQF